MPQISITAFAQIAAGAFKIDDVPVSAMAIISMMTGVSTWYRFDGRLSAEEVEGIYVNLTRSVVGLEPLSGIPTSLEEVVGCFTHP